MQEDGKLFLGASVSEGNPVPEELLLKYANRHGLVTGATGTGKTVTLQAVSYTHLTLPTKA